MTCFFVNTGDTTNTVEFSEEDTTVVYIHESDPQFVNAELPDEGAPEEQADEAEAILLLPSALHDLQECMRLGDRLRGSTWPIIARARSPGVYFGASGGAPCLPVPATSTPPHFLL